MAINPADLGAKRFIQVRTTLIESHGLLDAAIIGLIDFRSSGADAVTDEDGSWWRISMPELAKLLGMSTNTITRHLDALLKAGDLVRVKHQLDGVHDQTYSYRVQIEGGSIHSEWVGGAPSKRVDVPSIREESLEQDFLIAEDEVSASHPFDDWWARWPKKVQREAAFRAFEKVIAKGRISLGGLLALTERYAAAVADRDRQFLPNPSTWLNQGRWEDVAEEERMAQEARRAQQQQGPRPQQYDRPQDDDTLGAPAKGWE